MPVWWAWMSWTYYADQFDNDDAVFRLATFAAIFAVAALATFIGDDLAGDSAGFALAYLGLRALVIGLFVRWRRHAAPARAFCDHFICGYSLGAAVWWLYFGGFDGTTIRRGVPWAFLYSYAHLPTLAAVVAIGVGVEVAIEHATRDHLTGGERAVLAGGAALYLLGLTAVQRASDRSLARTALAARAGAVFLLLAVAIAGEALPPLLVAILVAVLIVGPIAIDSPPAGRVDHRRPQGQGAPSRLP